MCEKVTERPSTVQLADILRMHGEAYCKANVLTPEQYKVFNAIKNCRTSILGAHVQQCDHCSAVIYTYNSCRNRHCPTCESFKAVQWLEKKKADLLPVPYFHLVFTLPHELNLLGLYNKEVIYNLLFKSAWSAVKKLGADPKRLDGEMAMLSVLHTWSQNVTVHNHVHCIVPGGALQSNGEWKSSPRNYLFPVRALSKLFRGAYVSELRAAYENGKLRLPNQWAAPDFDQLLTDIMSKEWVVYCKKPFDGPESVLNYLGRYTHKIAISNYRILSCDEESVTFNWRDYSDENKIKTMTLTPEEFIRRFLTHVLPNGFMRIRGYGFLSNASKAKKVPIIQKSLDYEPPKSSKKPDIVARILELTGKDITICPTCNEGKLKPIAEISNQLRDILDKEIFDTS